MARSLQPVQDAVAAALTALPGVFSTIQWGGRAYKLPGPGGNRKKPKLVAHVCMNKAGDRVCVDFKLSRDRAAEAIDQHEWISPHSFRTLAPSGWISAEIRTAAQVRVLKPLLAESRALHGPTEEAPAKGDFEGETGRIDRVMKEVAAKGWAPREEDDFDAPPSRNEKSKAARSRKRR